MKDFLILDVLVTTELAEPTQVTYCWIMLPKIQLCLPCGASKTGTCVKSCRVVGTLIANEYAENWEIPAWSRFDEASIEITHVRYISTEQKPKKRAGGRENTTTERRV
jgi:hypothetical protein